MLDGDSHLVTPAANQAAADLEIKRRRYEAGQRHLQTPVTLALACGIEPDPWQEEFLMSTDPTVLLNCSRQSGKSECTSVLALHIVLTTPHSLVLLISPGERQSGELFAKVRNNYIKSGSIVPYSAMNVHTMLLDNGARVVSLPGKPGTIRGYSAPKLVAIDECAWVPDPLYHAVSPMLAVSRGRLIALSTPHGMTGWWAKAWHDTDQPWRRFKVPAEMCPRISPEFLESERKRLGSWMYTQEYGNEFLASSTALFTQDQINAAMDTVKEIASWDLLMADPDQESAEAPLTATPQDAIERYMQSRQVTDPYSFIDTNFSPPVERANDAAYDANIRRYL